MRSNWKGPYSDNNVDSVFLSDVSLDKTLKIFNRSSIILSSFVGLKVLVHNGRNFAKFTIKAFMVGHKFGEFVPTKLMGKLIHERKKKR